MPNLLKGFFLDNAPPMAYCPEQLKALKKTVEKEFSRRKTCSRNFSKASGKPEQ
jgi:hypothetical protein